MRLAQYTHTHTHTHTHTPLPSCSMPAPILALPCDLCNKILFVKICFVLKGLTGNRISQMHIFKTQMVLIIYYKCISVV